MIAQHQTDAPTSSAITALTTGSARRNSDIMLKSNWAAVPPRFTVSTT